MFQNKTVVSKTEKVSFVLSEGKNEFLCDNDKILIQ